MTTTKKLQRIRAQCVELLAIAEKRTQGKWNYEVFEGDMESRIYFRLQCDNGPRNKSLGFFNWNPANDASFIASCAGSAEAGWRATIAAIDAMSYFVAACESGNARSKTNYAKQKAALDAIIAAWPEELL